MSEWNKWSSALLQICKNVCFFKLWRGEGHHDYCLVSVCDARQEKPGRPKHRAFRPFCLRGAVWPSGPSARPPVDFDLQVQRSKLRGLRPWVGRFVLIPSHCCLAVVEQVREKAEHETCINKSTLLCSFRSLVTWFSGSRDDYGMTEIPVLFESQFENSTVILTSLRTTDSHTHACWTSRL